MKRSRAVNVWTAHAQKEGSDETSNMFRTEFSRPVQCKKLQPLVVELRAASLPATRFTYARRVPVDSTAAACRHEDQACVVKDKSCFL
jgi:hypothetical protein